MSTKKSPSTNQLNIDNALCFALYAASRTMTQLYRPFLTALNVTYPQFLVMVLLWENDHQSLKDLGDRLYLDSGTLTPLVKRLEQEQLVKRSRSKSDERSLLISLTPKGKKMQTKAKDIPEKLYCELGLEYQEFIALRDSLRAWIKLKKSQSH